MPLFSVPYHCFCEEVWDPRLREERGEDQKKEGKDFYGRESGRKISNGFLYCSGGGVDTWIVDRHFLLFIYLYIL